VNYYLLSLFCVKLCGIHLKLPVSGVIRSWSIRISAREVLALIAFYDKMSGFVDERRAVDTFYLNVTKAFDTVSHSIALFKLGCYSLDG